MFHAAKYGVGGTVSPWIHHPKSKHDSPEWTAEKVLDPSRSCNDDELIEMTPERREELFLKRKTYEGPITFGEIHDRLENAESKTWIVVAYAAQPV